MTDPSIFNQVLIWPILNLLMVFYRAFIFLKLPGALGLSIIGLTIFIRLLLNPLMKPQLESAQKMSKLKPKIDELTKKFPNDKMRQQSEQMKLYKEAGINPAAGCLPLLLQMPILIALYQVFWQVLNNGNLEKIIKEINQITYWPFLKLQNLDFNFFGVNLADKPSSWQSSGFWWLLLIPVITAGLQWWQTKMMATAAQPSTVNSQQSTNKKDEKKDDDMASVMQKQMGIMFPLMIGWFAYSFPVGLALYWNTFTVLGIIQQKQVQNAKIKKQNDK